MVFTKELHVKPSLIVQPDLIQTKLFSVDCIISTVRLHLVHNLHTSCIPKCKILFQMQLTLTLIATMSIFRKVLDASKRLIDITLF